MFDQSFSLLCLLTLTRYWSWGITVGCNNWFNLNKLLDNSLLWWENICILWLSFCHLSCYFTLSCFHGTVLISQSQQQLSKKMWVYSNEKSTYFVSWSKLMILVILHNLVLCRDRMLQILNFVIRRQSEH